MKRKNGFLQHVATALNIGGSAAVVLYDAGSIIVSKSTYYAQETVPNLSNALISVIKSVVAAIFPSERMRNKNRILNLEKKIITLHYEIVSQISKHTEEGYTLDNAIVRNLFEQIKASEAEIDCLTRRRVKAVRCTR